MTRKNAPNSEILADLGKPSPQTPLYSLCSQTATIQLAGFRKISTQVQLSIGSKYEVLKQE